MSRKSLASVERFYTLYSENKDYKTIASEMNIHIRMVSKYLNGDIEWFNNLKGDLHTTSNIVRIQTKAKQNEALSDFLSLKEENEKEYLSQPRNRYYVYLHKDLDDVVFYVGKGINGRKGSSSGRTTAWFLARKYREDMVKLIEQERIRLNELLEDSCGISKGRS